MPTAPILNPKSSLSASDPVPHVSDAVITDFLLASDAHINSKDNFGLIPLALRPGTKKDDAPDLAARLIELGARLDVVDSDGKARDDAPDLVARLIESGARLDVVDSEGKTKDDTPDLVARLIESSARLDVVDSDMKAKDDAPNLVAHLTGSGAQIDVVDSVGETPRSIPMCGPSAGFLSRLSERNTSNSTKKPTPFSRR